ncbi:transcriptional regulator [Micromonospora chersina]|uniref:transcriptional regulator n=1 Tax=Micromonospora chersina TaxID=47854 RepID=UPI0033E6C7E1
MSAREALEQINRTRTVTASAILGNHADLRAYPYRLLSIVSHHGIGGDQVTQAVAAAEVLEEFGWNSSPSPSSPAAGWSTPSCAAGD